MAGELFTSLEGKILTSSCKADRIHNQTVKQYPTLHRPDPPLIWLLQWVGATLPVKSNRVAVQRPQSSLRDRFSTLICSSNVALSSGTVFKQWHPRRGLHLIIISSLSLETLKIGVSNNSFICQVKLISWTFCLLSMGMLQKFLTLSVNICRTLRG